jgi:tRNA (guanine6-N2)-methyltransferase
VTARPAQYYALVVQGLEPLVERELLAAGATPRRTFARFDRRESLITFDARDLAPVMATGLLEDVFHVVLDVPTERGRGGASRTLRQIERTAFERALREHHALNPRTRGRSYRVVARMSGRHAFRREDVEVALARTIGGLLPRWVATRDPAAIEVWAHVIGDRTIAGVRLSTDELAQRRYKRAHLPASLKPTVAPALVLLAGVGARDVVVDPMAGAGTLLRERAECGRARLIAGGDSDPEALAAARTNVRRVAALLRWDATRMPLAPASVDAVITNPPYGRQHEAVAGLDRLYRGVARDVARMLRPGGRCVVLTGEPRVLLDALPASLRVREKHRLLVRGLSVTALVMVRE